METPETEAAVAAAVARAAADRTPLLIEGHGSKAGMLRPVQAGRTLSTRALMGVTLYAPKELVVSARAGTTIESLESTLAEAGQHLIGEPPDLSALLGTSARASVGGVVAANLSGPRRVAWGAMRDHVLGVRAVNGEGDVIRSGGRVLKNVTGLDLCKLIAGSHGTLAVLTEITLKVLPAPERSGTLVLAGLDAAAGVKVLAEALGSPFGVSGAAWLPEAATERMPVLAGIGPAALARIEESAASVEYRLGRLRDVLGGTVLDEAGSRAVWRAVRDATPLPEDEAVWRVSVRPSAGPRVLARLDGFAHFLDWGGGLAWLSGPGTTEAHGRVMAAALAEGGTFMLMRAPAGLRASVPVVPDEAPALAALTRRVKTAMDPHGILNPGRMWKGV